MNLYKKKYLYANGSSVTAGGGFEPIEKRKDVRPFYEAKGITLPETQIECSYPFFIAKQLNLELINEAKSGSGIERLIRTTFNWILENEEKVDKTIFLFEPQLGIRLDWFVFEWRDYGVLNAHKSSNGDYPFTLVKDYFTDDIEEQTQWNNKYKSAIDGYFSNFFDGQEHLESELKHLVMFLEFLNSRKIDYLISLPSYLPTKFYRQLEKSIPKKSNILHTIKKHLGDMEHPELETKGPACIWEYARCKDLLINQETESKDNHIGYKGNQHVADIIVQYIRHHTEIKYYSAPSKDLRADNITKNLSIKFVKVDNISDADFIYLADLSIFNYEHVLRHQKEFNGLVGFDDRFKEMQNYLDDVDRTWEFLRTMNKTNKRFFIKLTHERIFTRTFIRFLQFIEKEYGIKRSQIWYLDANVTEYPVTHNVPLEMKLRSFESIDSAILNSCEPTEDTHFRDKKIISLNNKVPFNRFLVLDRILYEYNDHNDLRNENIISIRESYIDYDRPTDIIIKKIKNDLLRYKTLGLPWFIDDWSHATQGPDLTKVYLPLVEYHKQCIFSITNESERKLVMEFDLEKDYESIKEQQFSEKCIIPILSGVFMFVITDGLFYRNMEKIGFDFSYLKKIFNISYLTNTLDENIEEVTKVVRFAKSKSIKELNEFRKQNYHYIEHNRNLMLDILLGDYNDDELYFWEQLSGKRLR